MSSTQSTAAAPNRCDVVEDSTDKPKPLSLSQFVSSLAPQQEFERTASYAASPKHYLEKTLGPSTFSQRQHLLSLPDKIDKDIYGTGVHKTHFQQHIASLLGKEHGLFFLTGVQAQLAGVKAHCDFAGRNRVAWHGTSHLETAEEKAYQALYGLERVLLGSREDANPSVEEVRDVLALPEAQRPSVVVLEIPNRVLGCQTYSFPELEAISAACTEAGVRLHCDGARIWEIEPWYQRSAGKTFADLGRLFDSVYVSFYKGLRGVAGAALVCDDEGVMAEAKKWQRRAGGNAFTLVYEVVDCERGFNENVGTFAGKWDKMVEVVEGIKEATKGFEAGDGRPVGYTADELVAARDRAAERMGARVFERLWPKKSLDEQSEKERLALVAKGESDPQADGKAVEDDRREIVEWMIVSALLEVKTQVFVDAYVALCEELVAGAKQ
ncbi:uncharacterized protein LTR77_002528 [Saxophila tyrrhenica]|uniref:Aromatic amino acid beta-eliminating lyase/threonine aldolase domain-containing protein n=1 Tax=Saxophila tyrrhenica TaxID=1690608 RepID=A0AAV9PLH4_9PEZI|nr:hypothetical protein LTR77_002528 [Saxophila tyrrhenica]